MRNGEPDRPARNRTLLILLILLVAVLPALGGGCRGGGGRHARPTSDAAGPPEPVKPAVAGPVERVYPALVRIVVVVAQPQAGRL